MKTRIKNLFTKIILSNLFIKVFVYTCAFILTLLLTLETARVDVDIEKLILKILGSKYNGAL